MEKLNKKYADLMRQAEQATGRKEAVRLIHKAAKLKTKFASYEMMQFDINQSQFYPAKPIFCSVAISEPTNLCSAIFS